MKQIYRIRQYPPVGGSLDKSRAVKIGNECESQAEAEYLRDVIVAFERGLSHGEGSHYDPSEYVYIAN